MQKLKIATHLLLLTTTPLSFVYPQKEWLPIAASPLHEEHKRVKNQENSEFFTYDQILNLLSELESGELEEKSSLEDLERINQFVAFLAQEGSLSGDPGAKLALEEDVEDLLSGEENLFEFAFSARDDKEHIIVPFNGYSRDDIVRCGLFSKSWKKTKKFVKKHKKAIIIGSVVVVAVAAVTIALIAGSSAGAATAVGGAAGAVAAGDSETNPAKDNSQTQISSDKTPNLKSVLDEEITSFKENIAREKFFESSNQDGQELSLEETGRIAGTLFAHESLNTLNKELSNDPQLADEVDRITGKTNLSIRENDSQNRADFGHYEIDKRFASDYGSLSFNPDKVTDFNAFAYQMRGEKALSYGYYNQAISDLSKAIDIDPTDPLPYLKRSTSYFNMGQYDRSLEDFQQFTTQFDYTPTTNPFSISEFSLGFSKGLPKGVYDSGEGMLLFLADFVKSPIHTSKQMIESLSTLAHLARHDEWDVIAKAIAPEVRQLIKEWDTLPSKKRGELAGYALGKHGGDILVPGALAKVASKSVKSAKELAAICSRFKIANETLILETATGIGNRAKMGQIVNRGKTTIALGEEVGLTAREMAQLKKTGKLEGTINKRLDRLVSQSQSEVLKAAIEKNRHVKTVRDYLKKPTKQIQKGIRSFEKQIATHQEKISNPRKYYPNWDKMHPEYRDNLINKKWPTEIQVFQEEKSVLQSILNERMR